jgi:hypothetical protein
MTTIDVFQGPAYLVMNLPHTLERRGYFVHAMKYNIRQIEIAIIMALRSPKLELAQHSVFV